MITFDKILRTYSGRPGCMCGCMGTYKQPSHAKSDNDWRIVSDRACKFAMNKLNKAIDWNDPVDVAAHYQEGFDGEHIYFLDTDTRTNVVYTTEKCHD